MLNNVIKENKEIIIFLIMFITFTFFAIIRVDHLEKSNFNRESMKEIVYNK